MSALEGIRVVDLTRYLSGPMAAMLLGDLGADVIKVEALPTGDAARQSGPFAGTESVYYMASNRNKRSIALDLRTDEGKKVLYRLIDEADVFLENFRPGTANAMGLSYETLKARNPRLVYVSISGFGNTPSGRDLPGFDQTVQAMSGLMSVTGTDETGPMRVGIAIADASTGVFSAVGILAALLERERTGEGAFVEATLMQSMMAMINYQAQTVLSLGIVPGPVGNDHPIMFPQGTFKAGGGSLTIACGNEKMWRRLCQAIGLDDVAEHPQYADNAGRMENRKELRRILEEALSRRPAAEWIGIINEAGVPCGPVLNLEEALNHETTQDLGLVRYVEHPALGLMPVLGQSVMINGGDPNWLRRHPPLLGEHSVEILSTLGYSAEEVDRLSDARVVQDPGLDRKE